MNVMDDWKLKTSPVVRLQQPSKTFAYFLLFLLVYIIVCTKQLWELSQFVQVLSYCTYMIWLFESAELAPMDVTE